MKTFLAWDDQWSLIIHHQYWCHFITNMYLQWHWICQIYTKFMNVKMVVKQMIRKKKSFNRSNVSTCIFVRTVPNVFEYLLRQVGTNEIFFGSLRQWGVAATRMKPREEEGHWTLNSFHRTTHSCVYQVVAVGLILVNMELYVREDSR